MLLKSHVKSNKKMTCDLHIKDELLHLLEVFFPIHDTSTPHSQLGIGKRAGLYYLDESNRQVL